MSRSPETFPHAREQISDPDGARPEPALQERPVPAGTSSAMHLALADTAVPLAPSDLGLTRTDAPAAALYQSWSGSPTLPDQAIDRYVLAGKIGAGAMGVVYAARDTELDRPVALKLIRPAGAQGKAPGKSAALAAKARLAKEARALARLSHPNVVRVYAAGEHGDHVFVAMELVSGISLKSWYRQEPRPRWRQVVDVFLAAGRGLAAAHAAGLIHRDFKPDNVLVGHDGTVKVVDFGLARGVAAETYLPAPVPASTREPGALGLGEQDTATFAGAILGTPAYMAPEQHLGIEVGPEADQYGFCAALYEGVYRTLPFDVPKDCPAPLEELCARKLEQTMAAPPVQTDVPAAVRAVILRGLAPAPDKRFPSMTALLAALAEAARPMRPRGIGLLTAAAVAILAGIGALGWMRPAVAPRLCQQARQMTQAVWDTSDKERIRTAFLATNQPYAAAAYERMATTLDTYAAAWAAMHTEACEATQIHGTQPAEVLDLRMQCLRRRLGELDALVQVFAGPPDSDVVKHAVSAAHNLPEVDACADLAALTASVPPVSEPMARAFLDQVRAKLDRIRALERAGKLREGAARAETALSAARSLDYAPVLAQAMYLAGTLRARLGNYAGAEELLHEALDAAARAKDDALIALIWARRICVLGYDLRRPSEALALAMAAETAAARAHDPLISAEVSECVAAALLQQGDYKQALQYDELALAIRRRTLPPEHPDIARSISNLGLTQQLLRRYREAWFLNEQALAMHEKLYGPAHPQTADCENNLAATLQALARYPDALRSFQRAFDVWRATYGSRHPYIARGRKNLGNILAMLGRHEEARLHFEEAVAVAEATLPAQHLDIAEYLNVLGDTLVALGQYERAASLYDRAFAIQRAAGPVSPGTRLTMHLRTSRALLGMGRESESALAYQRALDTVPEVRSLEPHLERLGAAHLAHGRFAAAQAVCQESLAAKERELGASHPLVGHTVQCLADAFAGQGRHDRALMLYRRALELYARGFGNRHPAIAEVLAGMAAVYRTSGRMAEAAAFLSQAADLARESGMWQRPQILFDLAQALWESGEREARRQALAVAKQAEEAFLTQAQEGGVNAVRRWLEARKAGP